MENAEQKNNVWKLVRTVLFFLVSGLLVLYILFELFIPDMTIKVFQFKPFVVITNSMEPKIDVDDLIFVVNVDPDNLKEGDIITFETYVIGADPGYKIITHIIHSIDENTEGERIFYTRRYLSTEPDPNWVLTDDDIIGKYAFRIPQMGKIIDFIRSPFGIAAISVNILVIGSIVYIVKHDKKQKNLNV